MIFYVDSSCIVRLLTRDGPILEGWGSWDRAFASTLARIEVRRALHRMAGEKSLDDSELAEAWADLERIEAGLDWIPVGDEMIALASEASATPVKSLDAIHLSSARLVRSGQGSNLVFATYDRRLADAARGFGFEVTGV